LARHRENPAGHIHVVARIWKGHLDGWYSEFAGELPAARRDGTINFKFVDGGSGTMTPEEMLLHVANHGTYHRGYIADMMYEAGLKPPTMDLPVFLRDVRAVKA
jgi:uncharacterized damage-inducible protein DinB